MIDYARLKRFAHPDRVRTEHFLALIERRKGLVFLFNLILCAAIRSCLMIKHLLSFFRSSPSSAASISNLRAEDPSVAPPPTLVPRISTNPEVLLVIEESLQACFRYRVKQKMEQMESLGWRVKWVSWKDASDAKRMVHFAHIVIFYRVPAFQGVVETILYAKRLGKVTFYDIDDLIFDPEHYPGPYSDYSRTLSRREYQGLVQGVDLYRKAISLCSYAIASTPSLAEKMAPLVERKKAFVHRNALDEPIIRFASSCPARHWRPFVTIFYGSGTRTHDADFQVAAEPIAELLSACDNVRLLIVGPLALPAELQIHSDKIDRIPFLADPEAYWEIVSQCDLSIAPLKSGIFEDCKSEIKWLEAALFHVPSVVSATRTYREILCDGIDGFLAASRKEWFEKLHRLVADPQLRDRMGQKAAESALSRYGRRILSDNLRTVVEAAVRQESLRGNVRLADENKSRVLFVNVLYPPQGYGGATGVMRNIVAELTKNHMHFEPYVFTYDLDGGSSPYCVTEDVQDGVHVTRLTIPATPRFDWQYGDAEVQRAFGDYLDFLRPDLIHFHCVQRLTASVVGAAIERSIPYVVTLHDSWWISDHQFLVDPEGRLCDANQSDPLRIVGQTDDMTASLRRRRILSEILKKASRLLAVSEFQAELYRHNGFENVVVDQNGLVPFLGPVSATTQDGVLRLGYAGGVCLHKGYYLLKEAVIEAKLNNCEVLVLDFSLPQGVEREESWGSTLAKLKPKISPERMLQDFFATIDVVIVPSLAPESFGLIVREALMAGVWVVASRRGALAEDIDSGRNGFAFDPENKTELIDLLRSLDSQVERFKARICVEKSGIRTIEQQVEWLTSLYREIVNGGEQGGSDKLALLSRPR